MASPTADQIANLTNEETDMVADTDVLGHIRRVNDKRNAQAKEEGWEWWTCLAESLADVYSNVYQLEYALAQSTYSDVHKEVYGCRPSGTTTDMTLFDLHVAIEDTTGQEGAYSPGFGVE